MLIYAHWEGYIKQSSINYLNFINSINILLNKFTTNFIAGAIRNNVIDSGKTKKVPKHIELVESYIKKMSEPIKIPYKSLINTESNLSSKVLLEILITLNLDPAPYELKFKLIDNHLLNQRNKVAHGQYLDIDIDIFIKTANETINLLQTFQEQIIDAAKAKRYLKHQVS